MRRGSPAPSQQGSGRLLLLAGAVFVCGGWLALLVTRFTPADHPRTQDGDSASLGASAGSTWIIGSKGCNMHRTRGSCVAARDEQSSQPCVWCCGEDCGGGFACDALSAVRARGGARFDGAGEAACAPPRRRLRAVVQSDSTSEVFASGDELPKPGGGQRRRWRGAAIVAAPTPPPAADDGGGGGEKKKGVLIPSRGCLEHQTRWECINARDGRAEYKHFTGNSKIYDEPCIWCCGEPCVGDDGPLCEPKTYASHMQGFVGRFDELDGPSTCGKRSMDDPMSLGDVREMSEEEKEAAIRRLRRYIKGGPAKRWAPDAFLTTEIYPGFDDGVNGKRPRLPPEAVPYKRGERPTPLISEFGANPPTEWEGFNVERSEEERAAEVDSRISELEGRAGKDAIQELAVLLMHRRRWRAATEALRKAVALDSKDGHSKNLLGHAMEGLRYSGDTAGPVPTDMEIKDTFQQAADTVGGTMATDWGNDSHIVDCHHGGKTWVHARPWPESRVFRKAATEVVGDMLAYYEVLRLRYGVLQPQFRAFAFSGGDQPWNTAKTLDETTDRFALSDVVILRGVLPPFVVQAVAAYYRRFTGKCHHHGMGVPLTCDPPEVDVFGKNPNDPYVFNAYSDRVGFFLNQFLRPLAEGLAGRRLNPTYAYLARYTDKPDGLQAHTDQVDNEYTMSMQLQYTPEDQGPCPIYVHKKRLPFYEYARNVERDCPHSHDLPDPYCKIPGDSVGGMLNLGDAVLFRGRQHIHFRPRWKKGRTCMSVLSHFGPRELQVDRGKHNADTCCAWPPLEKSNAEDCECMDQRLARAKRSLKRLIPLK
eukprot:TRINITY_DN50999_c0_g1_i1.p1 TRINITY_DN50999_c0_g1~~TRINITY_DN50999_c0_g1_i1.p1  ORF type:complete len:819 (+),score=215.73 TRINITY_DN50999_c0_g1_i1:105-2561(+)